MLLPNVRILMNFFFEPSFDRNMIRYLATKQLSIVLSLNYQVDIKKMKENIVNEYTNLNVYLQKHIS